MPGDPYTVHWREDMPPDIVDTEVLVGFLAHGNTGLVRYPDSGIPVAQVAVWNEDGNEQQNRPPRMFISAAAEQFRQRRLSGEPDDIGEEAKTIVSNTIRDWSQPPNAPATIARKGRNDPLVDTTLMMNSVDYLVVNPPFPVAQPRGV